MALQPGCVVLQRTFLFIRWFFQVLEGPLFLFDLLMAHYMNITCMLSQTRLYVCKSHSLFPDGFFEISWFLNVNKPLKKYYALVLHPNIFFVKDTIVPEQAHFIIHCVSKLLSFRCLLFEFLEPVDLIDTVELQHQQKEWEHLQTCSEKWSATCTWVFCSLTLGSGSFQVTHKIHSS